MYIHPASFFSDENYSVDPSSCFVIMPFSQTWSANVYRVIHDLVAAQGFQCRRADDYFDRVVLGDIWRRINEAAFVVADLTSENPNVYYELGIAHALGKDTISLMQENHAVPFDQRSFRVLEYRFSEGVLSGLEPELAEWINSLEYNSSPQMLLKRGLLERFNQWRTAHRHVDMSNADLSELNLAGVDFSSIILRGAFLRRVDLSAADLCDAKLTSADLSQAILDDAQILRGQISEANLVGASAKGTDMSRSTIIRSDLTGIEAQGCVLRGANLSESVLVDARLGEADLRDGIWLRVRMDNADLRDAQVSGLTVERATWNRYRRIFEAAVDVGEIVVEGD